MLSCLKKLVILTIILSIGAYVVNFWLSHKDYIFNESDLKKIGLKYVGHKGSVEDMVEAIRKDFTKLYPDDILPKEDVEMLFFGLGGYTGSIFLLHASLTEFLLVFGTPLPTRGYSVLHWLNITDVILLGEIKAWDQGSTVAVTNVAGSVVNQHWGHRGVVEYGTGLWKLAYGRGFIPAMLPHLSANTIFHSHDVCTFLRTLQVYAKSLWRLCLAHCPVFAFLQ